MLKKWVFLCFVLFVVQPGYGMWNWFSGVLGRHTNQGECQSHEQQDSVQNLSKYLLRQRNCEPIITKKSLASKQTAREICFSSNSLDLATSNNDPKCIAYVDVSEHLPQVTISDAFREKASFVSSLGYRPSLCFDKNDEHVAAKIQVKQHLSLGDLVRVYNRSSNMALDIPALLVVNILWNKACGRNLLAILTAPRQGKIYEVQNDSAKSLCVFDHDVQISSWVIHWHPKKDILQVAKNENEATLAFVDGISGKTIHSIKDKRDRLDDSAFNREGSLLAVTASNFTPKPQDHGLSIYDVDAGKLLQDLPLDQGCSMYPIAGWHEQQVAFMNWQKVLLYDLESGKIVRSFHDESGIRNARISPDGLKLMVANKNDEIKVFDVASGKMINSYQKEEDASAVLRPIWNCDSSAIYYMQQKGGGAYIYEGSLE